MLEGIYGPHFRTVAIDEGLVEICLWVFLDNVRCGVLGRWTVPVQTVKDSVRGVKSRKWVGVVALD